MGMIPIETPTGIQALYQGLVSGSDQVTVLVEDLKQIQSVFLKQTGMETTKIDSSSGATGRGLGRRPEMKGFSLEQCLEWDFKQFINRLLKIPRDKIDHQRNLMDFGFNSIGLTQFAVQLIKHYRINEITPALFFQYGSLEKLIQYFLTEYHGVIREFYREDADTPKP